MSLVILISTVVISYILGSIPPAYLIGRIFYKVDIRTQGSGNVGGANAGRLFGYKIMGFVVLYDLFKGAIAVEITRIVSINNLESSGFFSELNNIIALSAFFVIFGHCYSIWLRFSGGKGGATTAGVVFALDIFTFIIVVIFFVLVVGTTRFTSLGNLIGVLVIPILFNFRLEIEFLTFGVAIVLLIYWRHKDNLGLLLRGEERKIGVREKVTA